MLIPLAVVWPMSTEMQAVSAMRVYTTAETRGNSGRDWPGSLLVPQCNVSEAKPSVKGILVPIFCPWVLRILYNTGISCCEKAGQWQLAATTLATIIEETASFKWHPATHHPAVPWCLQERLADEISYNAAISACEKGGEWEWVSRAVQGFRFSAAKISVEVWTTWVMRLTCLLKVAPRCNKYQ